MKRNFVKILSFCIIKKCWIVRYPIFIANAKVVKRATMPSKHKHRSFLLVGLVKDSYAVLNKTETMFLNKDKKANIGNNLNMHMR